jgi:ketosteroid isomerase-like protein
MPRHFSIVRRDAVKRLSTLAIATVSLLLLGSGFPTGSALAQDKATEASDVGRINAASQEFVAAIAARDIHVIDKVWAHEAYAAFIGPLSTGVVIGWEGVRKAWEMRFSQFDLVTISTAESHVHTNGKVAWMVGIENIVLLQKDGKSLSFNTFVTNVFENFEGPLAGRFPSVDANLQTSRVARGIPGHYCHKCVSAGVSPLPANRSDLAGKMAICRAISRA